MVLSILTYTFHYILAIVLHVFSELLHFSGLKNNSASTVFFENRVSVL